MPQIGIFGYVIGAAFCSSHSLISVKKIKLSVPPLFGIMFLVSLLTCLFGKANGPTLPSDLSEVRRYTCIAIDTK